MKEFFFNFLSKIKKITIKFFFYLNSDKLLSNNASVNQPVN